MGSYLMISLLFLVAAAVVCQAHRESCWTTRSDKIDRRKILMGAACMKPRDVLQQLKVPEGYDYVYPSAALVKDCSGHICQRTDRECVANTTAVRRIKVEAFDMNDVTNRKCAYVEVVDHLSCGCQCDKSIKDCTMNEVFVAKMCRCECQPKLKKDCERKMREHSGMYMWDQNSCTCPCNNPRPCGTGEIWHYEQCRCVQIMSNEVSTN